MYYKPLTLRRFKIRTNSTITEVQCNSQDEWFLKFEPNLDTVSGPGWKECTYI